MLPSITVSLPYCPIRIGFSGIVLISGAVQLTLPILFSSLGQAIAQGTLANGCVLYYTASTSQAANGYFVSNVTNTLCPVSQCLYDQGFKVLLMNDGKVTQTSTVSTTISATISTSVTVSTTITETTTTSSPFPTPGTCSANYANFRIFSTASSCRNALPGPPSDATQLLQGSCTNVVVPDDVNRLNLGYFSYTGGKQGDNCYLEFYNAKGGRCVTSVGRVQFPSPADSNGNIAGSCQSLGSTTGNLVYVKLTCTCPS